MASERDVTIGFAVTGSLVAAAIIMSVAALALAAVDKDNIDSEDTRISDLEARVPDLVNDGADVSGSVSIIGVPAVTDGTTILPKLHFKALIAGQGIDVEAGDNTVTIANIAEVTLEAAAATEVDPITLVATSSTPNFPQVRNLVAGAGVTLTVSGNDIIISV